MRISLKKSTELLNSLVCVFDFRFHSFTVPLACLSCRHFYKPLLRRGFSKIVSQSAVFFLSAFFHEVSLDGDYLHFLC